MATDVLMPTLDESMTKGTVTTWLKSVGDTVNVDESIVEVSTDKIDSEAPSPVAGVLLQIVVPGDETVEVGTVVTRIGDASEAPAPATPGAAPAVPEASAAPAPATPATPTPTPAPAVPTSGVEGTEVLMPAPDESVTEGTVTTWLKVVRNPVEVDEPLSEMSTDKVDSGVPLPVFGLPAEIRVGEDETVEVGIVVAIISAPAPSAAAPATVVIPAPTPIAPAPTAPAPAIPAPAPVAPASVAPAAPASAPVTPTAPASAPVAPAPAVPVPAAPASQDLSVATTGGYLAPVVRKPARETDIGLSAVTGAGVGGRIRREGVEATVKAREAAKASSVQPVVALSAPAHSAQLHKPSPLRGTSEKVSRLRQTIARRMVESLQTAAQLTTMIKADVTKVTALHARSKDAFLTTHNTGLIFSSFFIRAATEALQYHPRIDARIDEEEVIYFDHENIGIAVDTPRGLLVSVITNTGTKDIPGLTTSIDDPVVHTRDSEISPNEPSGSTFTVMNTGSVNVLFNTPVLSMPETTIMDVGAIVKCPMVVKTADGSEPTTIRSMAYVSLSCDHHLVDGTDTSRYLTGMKKRLEEGGFEADLSF